MSYIAYKMIQDNMNKSGYCEEEKMIDGETKELMAQQNAILQLKDLSNIPQIDEYICVEYNNKKRMNISCENCKYSKLFKYQEKDYSGENYKPVLICLNKFKKLSFEDSKVDNEHLCNLYEG